MSGHARNAPSDAKAWLYCPGKINRVRKLGLTSTSGAAASEGTAAHLISELCLDVGLDAHDMIGTEIEADGRTFICDDDMADALQPGIDQIRSYEGKFYGERRVNITPWVGKDEDGNDQFGTLDRGVIGPDEIIVGDLKYGRGIPVACVGNPQIRLYGLAFYEEIARHLTKATTFRFIIDQPRNAQGGGEWVQTLDELLAFGEFVKERAKLTFDPNAKCVPSTDACLWCEAAKIEGACPEYEAWNLKFCDIEFENLDDYDEFGMEVTTPAVEGLTTARMKAIYDHLPTIRKFLTRVEATVATDVRSGDGEKYGLKIVAGRRSKRVHADEEKSRQWLEARLYDSDEINNIKLKSPTQLQKLVGKGKFPVELMAGGEPTPSIVSIEDARPALLVTHDFDNLDEADDDDTDD